MIPSNEGRRQVAKATRHQLKANWRWFRRRLLQISQRKLAELLGVSRGTVARWESWESSELPDVAHLATLASALRYPLDAVVKWIKEGEPNGR